MRYFTIICNLVTCLYLGRLLNNIGYSLDEGLPVARVFRSDLMMTLIWIVLAINAINLVITIFNIIKTNKS